MLSATNGLAQVTAAEQTASADRAKAVALIAAGGAARNHALTAVDANHYALLRTIEAGFGLSALDKAGAKSTPLLRMLRAG
jgi:hypothetical protein